MTKVEEAKAALWGQLVDSGELKEEDAEVLLCALIDAAHKEGNAEGFAEGVEFATMELALDNIVEIRNIYSSDGITAHISMAPPAEAQP